MIQKLLAVLFIFGMMASVMLLGVVAFRDAPIASAQSCSTVASGTAGPVEVIPDKITINAGQTIRVTVTRIGGSVDTYLELFDDDVPPPAFLINGFEPSGTITLEYTASGTIRIGAYVVTSDATGHNYEMQVCNPESTTGGTSGGDTGGTTGGTTGGNGSVPPRPVSPTEPPATYSGSGFRGYMQRNGIYAIYGNCEGRNCSLVGTVNSFRLRPERSPIISDTNARDGWYVAAYYLGKDSSGSGADVWQINVFGPEGLVDDGLLFFLKNGILTLQRR
jgi:hypothetical protein